MNCSLRRSTQRRLGVSGYGSPQQPTFHENMKIVSCRLEWPATKGRGLSNNIEKLSSLFPAVDGSRTLQSRVTPIQRLRFSDANGTHRRVIDFGARQTKPSHRRSPRTDEAPRKTAKESAGDHASGRYSYTGRPQSCSGEKEAPHFHGGPKESLR